jgi:hypothetical protein
MFEHFLILYLVNSGENDLSEVTNGQICYNSTYLKKIDLNQLSELMDVSK